MPICAYCKKEVKKLSESHAIPNAIFRRTMENGQMYAYTSDNRKNHKSQETGKARLLCGECEKEFNHRFDTYFFDTLTNWDAMFIKDGFGVSYTCDPDHFAQSLVSIFWRACVIENDFYSKANIKVKYLNQMYSIINKDKNNSTLKNCSVRISRLHDMKYSGDDWHSPEVVSQIISQVFGSEREYPAGQLFGEVHHPLCMLGVVMWGFLFHLILPKPKLLRSEELLQKQGFLSPKNGIVYIPPLNIRDYKPIAEIMDIGIKKNRLGHTTIKD